MTQSLDYIYLDKFDFLKIPFLFLVLLKEVRSEKRKNLMWNQMREKTTTAKKQEVKRRRYRCLNQSIDR